MSKDPTPLEYKTPEHRPPTAAAIASFIAGGFVGFIIFLIAGIAIGAATSDFNKVVLIAGCVVVGLGAIAGGVRAMGIGGKSRHMFLAGFLIGLAMMSLLEGACFYSR